MQFASDNTGPAHPAVLAALGRANEGYAPAYGAEPEMARLRDRLREVFEAPEAAVYLVATGTAANALILATLGQPWQTVFCHRHAHVQEDECNAPEFFTGGAKLTLVDGPNGMIDPDALEAAVAAEGNRGVHGPQHGPLSLTQTTEKGGVYSPAELGALTAIAASRAMPVHMDGARFANALVAAGCTPAEMTWKAGIDALSFGGTKNGLLGAEAVIFFDPAHAWEFELRRKRAGHLFSKHRYLTAQIAAYLEGDLWLKMARAANRQAARLAEGLRAIPDVKIENRPDANIIFFSMPRAMHRAAQAAGAVYNLWGGELDAGRGDERLVARLVCDWSARDEETDAFLALLSR